MSFFKPNTCFTEDYNEIGQYKLAWRLTLLFSIVFSILTVLFINIDFIGATIYGVVFLLSISSHIYLRITNKSKFIYWLFTISASALIIISIHTLLYTLHYSDILWMINIILFAFIGLSYRIAFLFVVIHSLSLIYYVFFSLNEHISQLKIRSTLELSAVAFEIVFAFLVLTYLSYLNIKHQRYSQEQLEKLNQQLQGKNKENVVLIKEVHHRVKNNLQIVVSLLRMQYNQLTTDESKNEFKAAIDRIMTISMIHEKLYAFDDLSKLEFNEYITNLVNDITSLHANKIDVNLILNQRDSSLNLKYIIPIGLILNELITNSIKHAFKKEGNKLITIQFQEIENGLTKLSYSDNGVWIEKQVDGFGTELLLVLSDQLDGKMSRKSSTTEIEFNFSEE